MQLHKKVVLVTGGCRGIGLAIALEMAREGATVVCTYVRNHEQAEKTKALLREIGAEAEVVQTDVTDPKAVDKLIRRVKTNYGRIDVLVNNAGITSDGLVTFMGDRKWQEVLDANLTGCFTCCRAASRLMVSQRSGCIINISSTSGISGPPGQANYAATKAGIIGFTKVLAKELGGYGIRANVVAPGLVDTAMTRSIPQEQLDQYLERIPLKRIGHPEEVASLVSFLASDLSSYVTGAVFVADGGMSS